MNNTKNNRIINMIKYKPSLENGLTGAQVPLEQLSSVLQISCSFDTLSPIEFIYLTLLKNTHIGELK